MPMPSQFDLVLACLLVGAVQTAVVVYFFLRLRAERDRPASAWAPRVSVLVPCAGDLQGLEDNVRSMLEQDYAGEVEYILVAPSTEDPAYRRLRSLKGLRLFASGRTPERSSGKICDLLFALERVPAGTELLLFADADVRVRRDWIASMAAPLEDPSVGVSTTCMLPVPPRAGFWSWLRLVYMGAGMPYLALTGTVCGQSFAVRRGDFDAWKVAELWSRSLMEDLSLSALAARSGKKVCFSGRAVPVAREDSDARGLLQAAVRWTSMFRVYFKRMWVPGLLLTAFKSYVLLWALFPPVSWTLLAVLWAVDAAGLFLVFMALRACLPDRFRELPPAFRLPALLAALSAPLLQLLYLYSFAVSVFKREFVWGRHAYRVSGPQDVERLLRPSDFPGRRFAAVLLGAVLLALSYEPGAWGILIWAAYAPLLYAIRGRRWREAFLWGWLFGLVSWLIGFRWFFHTTADFLGLSASAALPLYVLLCVFHGLMAALPACASRWLSPGLSRRLGLNEDLTTAVAFVPALVCVEAYFPFFSPIPAALTQLFCLPAVQIIEVFGTAGVIWLIAGFNASLFYALRPVEGRSVRRWGWLVFMTALALLNAVYGMIRVRQTDALAARRLQSGKAVRAAVLQGSIEYVKRDAPEFFRENIAVYNDLVGRALSESGGLDLVVWPQFAYERMLDFEPGDRGWKRPTVDGKPLDRYLERDIAHAVPMILGSNARSKTVSGRRKTYYAAFLTGSDRTFSGIIGKRYLTPFSEYIPFGRRLPFLYRLARTRMIRLSRGPARILEAENGVKLGVYICYEEVLPYSARAYARQGAGLLVALSSDAWLGGGAGNKQHLGFSVLRAIESRRALLRSVTSGISCYVDPAGRLVRSLPVDARGYFAVKVPLMDAATPHMRIGRLFYHLAALMLAVLVGLSVWPSRRGVGSLTRLVSGVKL
ncbi:MAG: apolipoprotein N-acyltransferase [Elusimicrobiota bacterium]